MASTQLAFGNGIVSTNMLADIFPGLVSAVVGTPTPMMAVQRVFWQQVDSLYSGTQGMRLAAKTYLPMHPAEDEKAYQVRLARSTLHNHYKSSIQSAVGKIFSKDVHLDNASTSMQLVMNDVDSQGQNITQFSKFVEEDAINHGVSFILIDHTRVPQDFVTLADKMQSGARPYWVNIPATRVLDARAADFGGSQRLSYFRYEEDIWEPSADGFSGSGYKQVRIFKQDPGGTISNGQLVTDVMFAVYREPNDGDQWQLVDSGVLVGLSAIPVVPVYTNRTAFFMGRPPLQDLADVNVQHWQCHSDYQHSLHIATIPFLLTKGLGPQMDENGAPKQLTVDVGRAIIATDKDADAKWVEVSGASLSAAKTNLDDLEETMEKLGMTLCAQIPGGTTATQTAVNASEANSIIKGWALSLQDAINGALALTSEFLTEPATADAKVNVDYAIDYASDVSFKDVLTAFQLGAIDSQTVVDEGKRRNVLDPLKEIKPAAAPTLPTNTVKPPEPTKAEPVAA